MRVKMIEFKTHRQYNFSTYVNGVKLRVHVRYNSYTDNYYINIDKLVNSEYVNIINSIPLYTGIDLFMQHPQLNLGILYVIPMQRELYGEDPSSETIQNYIMLWVSN